MGNHILLAITYAASGKWDELSRIPGYSLIEVNNVVHEFVVGNTDKRVELHTPTVNPFVSSGYIGTSVNQGGNNGLGSTLTSFFSSRPFFTSTNVSLISSSQGEFEKRNGEGKGKLASSFFFPKSVVSLQKDNCRYGLVPLYSGTDLVSAGKQFLASSSSPSVSYTSPFFPKSQSSIATSDVMSGHDEIKLAMATNDVISGALVSGTVICGLEKESSNIGKQVKLPGSRSCSMGLHLLINGEMVAMPTLGRHLIFSADAGLVLKNGAEKSKLATGYSLLRYSSVTDSSSIVNGGGSSSYGSTIWFPLKIPWLPWQICGLEKESNHTGKQVELPGSRSSSMGLHLLINGETVAMPTLGRHQIFFAAKCIAEEFTGQINYRYRR